MRLIKPSFEIMEIMGTGYGERGFSSLELIERAGRTCYKSEDKITSGSAVDFVQRVSKLGHESVLEHSAMTVKIICDRGVSHELVRHRLCAFSQESTRYCNYSLNHIAFIIPSWVNILEGVYDITWEGLIGRCSTSILPKDISHWFWHCALAERDYNELIKHQWNPQQARSVLPNSLKTEIVVTANFREWRRIFKLRTAKAAHPQIREIMIPLLKECSKLIPIIFDDITY